jgi:hypothetical protein
VVLGVEAADVGIGPGLSPQVAAAIPALVGAVLAELEGVGTHGPTPEHGHRGARVRIRE